MSKTDKRLYHRTSLILNANTCLAGRRYSVTSSRIHVVTAPLMFFSVNQLIEGSDVRQK